MVETNLETRILEINSKINSNNLFVEKLKEFNKKEGDSQSSDRRNRDIFTLQAENGTLLAEKLVLLDKKFSKNNYNNEQVVANEDDFNQFENALKNDPIDRATKRGF